MMTVVVLICFLQLLLLMQLSGDMHSPLLPPFRACHQFTALSHYVWSACCPVDTSVHMQDGDSIMTIGPVYWPIVQVTASFSSCP